MRVVVAPDSFKGSISAVDAARAIGAGVTDAVAEADVRLCPVADGGEGTLDVVRAAGGERVELTVAGPLSEPVPAWYAVLDDWAYVESARACGLEYVTPDPRTALTAHTRGVGELIAHALDYGVRGIVLTVGGTATTDGGAGMLLALGARLRDASGAPVGTGADELASVTTVDLSAVHERLGGVPVRVATDVTNPLLGPRGAASVFGPQKGAGPAEVARLETALTALSHALRRSGAHDPADDVGAGAGGGL
ncbi:glycerate kinase, partial [Saccharomonospora saliphila]|uniref:glycerate kinase n=1 Tax=Saccharomonospora saliphila TaxID=369829 RepID=UPI0006628E96